MMANTAQMENNPNPGISGSQRNRRGSGTNNEETIRSRDSTDPTMIDASFLPTEILLKIFHYLDFYDILAARLCCTRWFYISNYPEFVSKRIFKITGGLLDSEHPAAKVISASKIENLYLQDIQFGDVDELFKQIGANLKTLTLESHFLQEHLLNFTHFTNLQSLTVCRIRWSLFKDVEYLPIGDLSRLKELELTENDSRLNKYLLGCCLCVDFLVKLTLEFGKESELQILKILDKHAETLRILALRYYNRYDLDVSQWKRIASKLSLKELSLGNGFSCDIVVEMVKNQKSLRSLHLHGSDIVDDEYLTLIVQAVPQIEIIFLINCQQITDIGVGQLAKLSKLTVLGLESCLQITSDGIRSIIGQEASTQLQELHMKLLVRVGDDAVCCCAKKFQHLRVLDLRVSEEAVTDKSVNTIFESQRNLRDLRLDGCKKLTDFGMLGHCLVRKLEKLERLSLRYCEKLSNETLCGMSAPHLKFLDIRGCLRMTSRGISALVKNCPAIEEIAFTYSEEMNEEVVNILTNGLSRLRILNIDRCSEVLKQGTANWKLAPYHSIEYGDAILKRRTTT